MEKRFRVKLTIPEYIMAENRDEAYERLLSGIDWEVANTDEALKEVICQCPICGIRQNDTEICSSCWISG